MSQNLFQSKSLPVVSIHKQKVVTLSTDVADYFQKEHRNVVRDIESLIKISPLDRLLNFEQTVVERPNPSGGAPIKSKVYRLTRDGFIFLAMGFTGKKAQAFKWAYIDAFNAMEKQLFSNCETLTPQQQYIFKKVVAKRAKNTPQGYKDTYSKVYERFQVSTYKQIPSEDFQSAIEFIQSLPEYKDAPQVFSNSVNSQDLRKEVSELLGVLGALEYLKKEHHFSILTPILLKQIGE